MGSRTSWRRRFLGPKLAQRRPERTPHRNHPSIQLLRAAILRLRIQPQSNQRMAQGQRERVDCEVKETPNRTQMTRIWKIIGNLKLGVLWIFSQLYPIRVRFIRQIRIGTNCTHPFIEFQMVRLKNPTWLSYSWFCSAISIPIGSIKRRSAKCATGPICSFNSKWFD